LRAARRFNQIAFVDAAATVKTDLPPFSFWPIIQARPLQESDRGNSGMTTETEARVSEFAALESQITGVQDDVREIRTSMTKVADALVKLAVIEERHLTTQRRVDRLEIQLDDAVKKTAELEKANIKHEAMAEGVKRTVKVIWGLVGAGVLAVAAKIFHQYA
jgi:hypothetical protein